MRTWLVTEPVNANSSKPIYLLFEEDTLRDLFHQHQMLHKQACYDDWLDGWIVCHWATQVPDNIVQEIINRRQTSIISDSN